MAQYRQGGFDRFAVRSHDFHSNNNIYGNGASTSASQPSSSSADHVSIGIRGSSHHKHSRARRSHRSDKSRKISIGAFVAVLSLILLVALFSFNYLSKDKDIDSYNEKEDYNYLKNDDFLANVTRMDRHKVLKFGKGLGVHGRDSRDWDRDDRRRDEDYDEDSVDNSDANDESDDKDQYKEKVKDDKRVSQERKSGGLYNEAGRNELKMYEAEYEASLKGGGLSGKDHGNGDQVSGDVESVMQNEEVGLDDEYDDGIDFDDTPLDEYDDISDATKSHVKGGRKSYGASHSTVKERKMDENVKGAFANLSKEDSSFHSQNSEDADSAHGSIIGARSSRKTSFEKKQTKRKSRRHKFSGNSCDMKLLNSTSQLVEPLESRKFARFTLQYTDLEGRPDEEEHWEPRFAGHQSLQEREESFKAQNQKINCGFVKGPKGTPSTGFDLAEDDARFISTCHIAVISCIFGNSDHLRSPAGKAISRLSRKNVCFVMFMDEITLQTLSSEGQSPDSMGFIGLWKIVVVKNLPYTDMRRVGKIPKLLPHRLFPSARYSIWLDSKLRLQLDPLLILEYFLWRKGHEYAISNHYDRHCVWEEVAQNKKLNKYNHTVIDQQFAFYQADGLKRFDASDPNKLLPSNVPEGSFIIRAHTPMSNLFSCLWFNEVDRFTPRDQLSFAYTFHKLRRANPGKPFYLNMFKDCERRAITKLFRHRAEEKRNISQLEME
ncbi:Protein of unknown function DUF616 [Dillenia turbinata]|uniref:TOD1/MUCI70 glycosyltransferase-like domain-containing protein n=1 Tax=Dillenia turbinata TaxID=194707 RepID=A0AAN8W125_9MAGN